MISTYAAALIQSTTRLQQVIPTVVIVAAVVAVKVACLLTAVYERNDAEQYGNAVCAYVPVASVYTCHRALLLQEMHLLADCQW